LAATRQLSDSWDIGLLAHVSVDPMKQDENGDGFLDEPTKRQFNLANRWVYRSDNGMQLRFGVKGVYEKREGGQKEPQGYSQYKTDIENKHFNSYVKLAFPLKETSNLAFIGDYTFHELNSSFGLKDYNGHQNTATLNILLQSNLSEQHSYTLGVSGRWDDYVEKLKDIWLELTDMSMKRQMTEWARTEKTAGVFGEYTFTLEDKLTLVAGARADYYNENDKSQWLFTPRATIKYNFTDDLILRASTGKGFRTANAITDNIGVLATGRKIVIPFDLDLEQAWTLGSSLSWSFPLGIDKATLSADYYYTNFANQVIADQESLADYAAIRIYNLNGKSYSHTYQVDFSVEPFERFTALATFRYTDAKATYPDKGLREVPLTDRYKGVLNLQYATRMSRWTFDVTAQLNGQTRLPDFTTFDGKHESPVYPLFFGQITRKFKGLALYAGVENLLDYKQKNPIINANNPFSPEFNSSVIWGPLMGRRIYAGLRWELL
jgi:outer membrane receptor protein involved in Fe transport